MGNAMEMEMMTLKEAFMFVQKRRHLIRPNNGFIKELQELEMQLFAVEKPTLFEEELVPMKVVQYGKNVKKKGKREWEKE